MLEIVVLAMLAGFIALRLISVLGRHDESSEPPAEILQRTPAPAANAQGAYVGMPARAPLELPEDLNAAARSGLQEIAEGDPNFDPAEFLRGATAAYGMILSAFWEGDKAALKELVSDEIGDDFGAAIDVRKEEELTLENELVSVENAEILSAERRGQMAEITVRFDADLVSVTKDKDGTVVAGSTSDAVQAHDIWTFSRLLGSDDPAWVLIETDAAS